MALQLYGIGAFDGTTWILETSLFMSRFVDVVPGPRHEPQSVRS